MLLQSQPGQHYTAYQFYAAFLIQLIEKRNTKWGD